MKILLTGYPGFLSRYLYQYFLSRGYEIDTLGLNEAESAEGCRHYIFNLTSGVPKLIGGKYDIVIHAAGKAHTIPRCSAEIASFFDVNVKGTENLLNALCENAPASFIFISSVAVYGAETGERISENAKLNANDPYGLSKIMAERLISQWCVSHNVRCGIVRLPIIAGSDAPGNWRSMVNAVKRGYFFNIGSGACVRSVISVFDIAPFLEILSNNGGIFNLTDNRDVSFSSLYKGMRRILNAPYRPSVPKFLAWPIAAMGELLGRLTRKNMPLNFKRYRQMTKSLTFDGTAAITQLKFSPTCVAENLDLFVKK